MLECFVCFVCFVGVVGEWGDVCDGGGDECGEWVVGEGCGGDGGDGGGDDVGYGEYVVDGVEGEGVFDVCVVSGVGVCGVGGCGVDDVVDVIVEGVSVVCFHGVFSFLVCSPLTRNNIYDCVAYSCVGCGVS